MILARITSPWGEPRRLMTSSRISLSCAETRTATLVTQRFLCHLGFNVSLSESIGCIKRSKLNLPDYHLGPSVLGSQLPGRLPVLGQGIDKQHGIVLAGFKAIFLVVIHHDIQLLADTRQTFGNAVVVFRVAVFR